jgi:uncharacterized phage protein gp47/JayE
MSLPTPTTAEISATIVSQLESSLSQTIPLLPKAFSRVLAKVLAGVFVLLWKYAAFQFLQLFVQHASMAETEINGTKVRPLVEWGRLIGVGEPIGATRAEHTVAVSVQNQTGEIKGGITQMVRPDTGVIYTVVSTVELNAPIVQITIRAASDQDGGDGSGTIGSLEVGDIVEFAKPLPQVAREATIIARTVTGANAESPEAYRARIFRRFQRKPQGGAYADYQMWGEEVPGIAHVYPYTGAPGEVDVYVEATTDSYGDPDGIPVQDQLDAVRASIQLDSAGLATRRPANAAVNTLPIDRIPVDLFISGLTPDTAELRAAIAEGADEFLRSREPYIEGLSSPPREDRVTRAAIAGIVDSIVSAELATVTSVEINPGPSVTLAHGQKAKLGTANFV